MSKLHDLRVYNEMLYPELSEKSRLPMNILRGMENGYIPMGPIEIFKLSEALNINYIDLCSTWEEVKGCLEFKLYELYNTKTGVNLKIYAKKGFYVPNYTRVYPHEYTIQTISNMCDFHRTNLLGVKIRMHGLDKRIGIGISTDKIRLSTICNIAFRKNLRLSYVLGGNK